MTEVGRRTLKTDCDSLVLNFNFEGRRHFSRILFDELFSEFLKNDWRWFDVDRHAIKGLLPLVDDAAFMLKLQALVFH